MEEQLLFADRAEFRKWLEQNKDGKGVWLIFGKTSEVKSLKPEEALEEALCYGWIDGQIKSIDETSYMKKLAPRRKGSNWSDKNKGLVQRLIEEGRMTQWGQLAIDQAKQDGIWDAEKPKPAGNEEIEMLEKALDGKEPALTNYRNMSNSVRKTYAMHYLSAKSEATREKRLAQIVDRLNENKKPM